MQWNEIVANIKDFFSQPVPIIGCSIAFLLVFILVIFSKTSIGKKALNKLTGLFESLKDAFGKFVEVVNSKIKELKDYYESGKARIEAQVLIISEMCDIVAENSHNEKVKEGIKKCKEKLALYKTDYELLIEEKVKQKAEEVEQKVRQEYEEKYKIYFEEKKLEIEELLAKAEKAAESVENKAKTTIVDVVNVAEEIQEVIENEKQELNTDSTEEAL